MKKRTITLFIIVTLMIIDTCAALFANNNVGNTKTSHMIAITEEPIFNEKIMYDNIKGTVYHPVPAQTDDSPLYTADNSFIDTTKINELRWIAVSRDILNRRFTGINGDNYIWSGKLKLGDTVWIDYDTLKLKSIAINKSGVFSQKGYDMLIRKHELIKGFWIVKDVMGSHYYRTDSVGNKERVDIVKAIDFLQHPKTGFLDMWDRSIIITKRKIIGYKTNKIYVGIENQKISKNKRKTDAV